METKDAKPANIGTLRDELLDELDPLEDFAAALNRHPKTVMRWRPPIIYVGRKPFVPRKRGRQWILDGCQPIDSPRRASGRRSAA
jgi:hypothetical protein